jgi:mycothiol conjugate amidase Mca
VWSARADEQSPGQLATAGIPVDDDEPFGDDVGETVPRRTTSTSASISLTSTRHLGPEMYTDPDDARARPATEDSMPEPLTLMAVHAHPDDEAIGTGGVLARAAAEGIRTVLVTCTGGEVGEINPDTRVAVEDLGPVRERELREACAVLNVTHLELLGYRDSGMAGTSDNNHPDSFAQADLDDATARLVELVRTYRPSVIVTYDESGFYGHPDHINAHRIATRAYELAGDPEHRSPSGHQPWEPAKLYYTVVSRSAVAEFGARLRDAGIEPPLSDGVESDEPSWGTPDELVTTVVDVSAHVGQKRQALYCHATQMGPEVFFAKLPEPLFDQIFARESFQLVRSRVAAATPETDLFAGLR